MLVIGNDLAEKVFPGVDPLGKSLLIAGLPYRVIGVATKRGTLFGSLFASFLLIGFQEYFRALEAWRLVMYGALMILIMLFAPKGLAGLKKYVW